MCTDVNHYNRSHATCPYAYMMTGVESEMRFIVTSSYLGNTENFYTP